MRESKNLPLHELALRQRKLPEILLQHFSSDMRMNLGTDVVE